MTRSSQDRKKDRCNVNCVKLAEMYADISGEYVCTMYNGDDVGSEPRLKNDTVKEYVSKPVEEKAERSKRKTNSLDL